MHAPRPPRPRSPPDSNRSTSLDHPAHRESDTMTRRKRPRRSSAPSLPSHDELLALLRDRAPRSVALGELLDVFGLSRDALEALLARLDELAEERRIRRLPGRRFRWLRSSLPHRPGDGFVRGASAVAASPAATSGKVRGRFTQHPRGFGFVAAEDGGPDVFVPEPYVGGAMHADRVEVRAFEAHRGRQGEVVRVLERGIREVTGVVDMAGPSQRVLEPDDPRLRGPMLLRGRLPRAALDQKRTILAEIVRYPEDATDLPEARFREVLGTRGELGVELRKILLREGIVEPFPEEVLAEAEALPGRIPASERKRREDLRHLPMVTIDPPDAKDHDDALWAERLPDGGYRLLVAIADVSHYVRPDTALDREAMRRAFSVYLPDRVVPMLPERLSADLASLRPGVDRLCLAVEIELGPGGAVRAHRFIEGLMRSRARLAYEGVARALGLSDRAPTQRGIGRHLETLRALHEASRLIRGRRRRRGALDFDLPEAKVLLDPAEGEPVQVLRSRHDEGVREAYRIVEDMMILANEVVAADLERRGEAAIYRVHDKPDAERVARFAELATQVGFPLDPEEARDSRRLGRFLRRIEGSSHQPVLAYLLLRAMPQAVDDTENIGHFGLASRHYLHFTSPIRRYPDLLVHRIVRSVIRGEARTDKRQRVRLRRAAAEASWKERRAMLVERDVVNLYRCALMRDRLDESFEGTVTHLSERGVFVSLDDPFVEALVPAEWLGEEAFEMDSLGIRLSSRSGRHLALGDRLRIRIEDVSLEQRTVTARLEAPLAPDDEAAEAHRQDAARRAESKRKRRGRSTRPRGGSEAPPRRGRRSGSTATPRRRVSTKKKRRKPR